MGRKKRYTLAIKPERGTFMESFGQKVKYLRNSIGYSQERLAREIGISTKSIQRYESGKYQPDTYAVVKLATFFGVSADYLLGSIGLIAQRQEAKKIPRHGQRGALYKQYIACKNHYAIDEASDYYWIFLNDDGSCGGQTEWAGWANREATLEIRRLRPVNPYGAIRLCAHIYQPPLIVNSPADVIVFLTYGGQAIVRADICEKYLEWFCRDYIGPHP